MSTTGRSDPLPARAEAVFWAQPLRDYIAVLELATQHFSLPRLLLLLLTAGAGWWLYVPAHELLHAFGCLWSGGEVTRLELAPEYGAAWLQQFFPWLVVGSDYAGQLTGFDTHGNDLVYLITVLAPYALTLFPGMTLWIHAGHGDWQATPVWVLTGVSFSMVAAPFISTFGDMYEAGSIIATRALLLVVDDQDAQRWRSDDMWLLLRELAADMGWLDMIMLLASFALALLLAWSLYWLGRRLAVVLLAMLANKTAGGKVRT